MVWSIALPDDEHALSLDDYRTMAQFRCELRRFLAFSRSAANKAGLPPQQYQALLAIKGHRSDDPITIGELASELFIKQHTAVELAVRLEKAGLVEKTESTLDRRRVHLHLTPKAERVLESLVSMHVQEMRERGSFMTHLLTRMKFLPSDGEP